MNIVLFEAEETARPLPKDDRRAQHILGILRCGIGDSFDAGLVNGPRGKAVVLSNHDGVVVLDFKWGAEPPLLDPITLIVGLPRPQTARRILTDATTLGVEAIHFVAAERGEDGYARSKLWTTGEWRRHLLDGASQAFSTRLPVVTTGRPLQSVIDDLHASLCKLALDNYEASQPLPSVDMTAPLAFALGPERGWSAEERDALRGAAFRLVHLGERVLRVETAAIAAVVLAKARLSLL